jgi:hypothetical protein
MRHTTTNINRKIATVYTGTGTGVTLPTKFEKIPPVDKNLKLLFL